MRDGLRAGLRIPRDQENDSNSFFLTSFGCDGFAPKIWVKRSDVGYGVVPLLRNLETPYMIVGYLLQEIDRLVDNWLSLGQADILSLRFF